ncbi:MAG: stage IV sporulation protein A, partial [Clostridia bacterium]
HKYNCEVIAVDVLHLEIDDINSIMYAALSEFPVKKIEVEMPKWMRKLPKEHWLISDIIKHIKEHCDSISKMKDCEKLFLDYNCNDSIETTLPPVMNMGTGLIKYEIIPKQMLYYKILSELCAVDIFDDFALMSYISDISKVKEKFEKIAAALNEADESGYGVARPPIKDMELYPPEITKHGNRYGVIMKASAPAYHIMKVDVKTEVSPMMGTEEQSRYMLGSFEDNPQALWETNMFGKTLAMLAEEGLADKLTTMPIDLQNKLRRTVGRIVNENKSNMFCMLF